MIDFVLHSDRKLLELVAAYGPWVYGVLFAIVFAETGLVVTPFLPGDSLLFATGALCATGALSTPVALGLLALAAFTGNAVNYAIGRTIGPRVFSARDASGISHRLLNRDHLKRAHGFFEQYGGKAVILGRFVPIVRTFAPFLAGIGAMAYHTFLSYNVIGAAVWVSLLVYAGYLFGNIPWVKDNLGYIVVAIVVVSLIPMVVQWVHERRANRKG
jgi:membrane-associated protein